MKRFKLWKSRMSDDWEIEVLKLKKIVKFDDLEEWILRNYGKKCKKYDMGCVVCSVWRTFYDLKGLSED